MHRHGLASSSTATAACADEGFDPYADPKLPRAAAHARPTAGLNGMRISQPVTVTGASAKAMHWSSAAQHQVVTARGAAMRQRTGSIGADDSNVQSPK